MTLSNHLVAGVDYGTDSVRVAVWDIDERKCVASVSSKYPRWSEKKFCVPEKRQFRQHPSDYIEALEACFSELAGAAGKNLCKNIKAIAFATTGSTLCPVDDKGTPLALHKEFRDEPDAMFLLWKDHSAIEEAAEVNAAFLKAPTDYTRYQGTYSSEWWWAKILYVARKNPAVLKRTYTWVEQSDWLPNLLLGTSRADDIKRNACAAGHKALYSLKWGGLPDNEVLEKLHPHLKEVALHYALPPLPAGKNMGVISGGWAEKLGVSVDTLIVSGSLDAHAGGVGAHIKHGRLVKVIGTSTVDLFLTDYDEIGENDLRDICGIAENTIVPGYLGGESGQAAFGDVYRWYADQFAWVLDHIESSVLTKESREGLSDYLRSNLLGILESHFLADNDTGLTALDWFNGRRYPTNNEEATASVSGLSLATTPPQMYQALVTGTVMGGKLILKNLLKNGISIDEIVLVGGIPLKSSVICQMFADIFELPVIVCSEQEICAKGAAIYAAVGAGLYGSVEQAQERLCQEEVHKYLPEQKAAAAYREKFGQYLNLARMTDPIIVGRTSV